MSRRNPNLSAPADVLQALFENGKSPLSDQFLRWKIWLKWSEIVGDLAENTRPVGYHEGTLIIWTKNSAWLHNLLFFRDEIKTNVNKFVGRNWAHRIHVTADKRHVPEVEEMDENAKKFISK